jgi:threonine dehydratase
MAETGATLIHPFENLDVMAGQGTAAVELMQDVPELDLVLCPVGGGGLLAGVAVATRTLRPATEVIATEPARAGDTAESFRAGRVVPLTKANTIADGLRTTVGAPNFEVIQRYVRDVVTVEEETIITAMRTIWETMKIIIEPSSAVVYAPILEGKVSVAGKRVGLIITGGNVDLDALPWVAEA